MDVTEKYTELVIFYLAKSFRERLKVSKLHENIICVFFLLSTIIVAGVRVRVAISDRQESCR